MLKMSEFDTPESIHPDREIVKIRTVNAPRITAYKTWSDPNHLKNWWGHAGFTNTFHEFEFKEGGRWNFTMNGPEKGNYVNSCEFTDLVFPSMIAGRGKVVFPLPATNVMLNLFTHTPCC